MRTFHAGLALCLFIVPPGASACELEAMGFGRFSPFHDYMRQTTPAAASGAPASTENESRPEPLPPSGATYVAISTQPRDDASPVRKEPSAN